MSTRNSPRKSVLFTAGIAVAALALTACGATADDAGTDGGAGSTGGGNAAPATGLQLMVPNAPGGGYDTTARTVAQVT